MSELGKQMVERTSGNKVGGKTLSMVPLVPTLWQ
jgi:hypothetical protein